MIKETTKNTTWLFEDGARLHLASSQIPTQPLTHSLPLSVGQRGGGKGKRKNKAYALRWRQVAFQLLLWAKWTQLAEFKSLMIKISISYLGTGNRKTLEHAIEASFLSPSARLSSTPASSLLRCYCCRHAHWVHGTSAKPQSTKGRVVLIIFSTQQFLSAVSLLCFFPAPTLALHEICSLRNTYVLQWSSSMGCSARSAPHRALPPPQTLVFPLLFLILFLNTFSQRCH